MNDINDNNDEKTYEEKREDFLKVLGLLSAIGARKSEIDQEEKIKRSSMIIGKVLYSTYLEMLAAGFNEQQALDLTKCLIFGAKADDVLKR